jgi:hypothetical protein
MIFFLGYCVPWMLTFVLILICCVEDVPGFENNESYHGYVVAFKMHVKVKHVAWSMLIAFIPLMNIICSVCFVGMVFNRFAMPPLARFGNKPLFK